MKKYKLIKTYPGSLPIGTVAKANGFIAVTKHGGTRFDGSRRLKDFELPGKYPDFWEELIEPTYKILSFRSLQSFKAGHIVEMKRNSYGPERYLKDSDYWEVHSVKRLSDDEVFTIGDNTNKGVIESFRNYDNVMHCSCKVKNEIIYFNGNINKLSHSKKPLFTTEDDVDIYEGDKCFGVEIINNYKLTKKLTCIIQPTHPRRHCLYFSTKKAAEEYILFNKPCLSIKDVENSFTNLFDHKKSVIRNLKNLINDKK